MKMFRNIESGWLLALSAIAVIGFAACTTTTPTGTTKDMFDMTSSTSDRSWFSIDGQLKNEYKAIAFATYAYESVLDDMARGEGEYLTSMATLLKVPEQSRSGFRSMAQASYSEVVRSPSGTPSALLHSLTHVIPK